MLPLKLQELSSMFVLVSEKVTFCFLYEHFIYSGYFDLEPLLRL